MDVLTISKQSLQETPNGHIFTLYLSNNKQENGQKVHQLTFPDQWRYAGIINGSLQWLGKLYTISFREHLRTWTKTLLRLFLPNFTLTKTVLPSFPNIYFDQKIYFDFFGQTVLHPITINLKGRRPRLEVENIKKCVLIMMISHHIRDYKYDYVNILLLELPTRPCAIKVIPNRVKSVNVQILGAGNHCMKFKFSVLTQAQPDDIRLLKGVFAETNFTSERLPPTVKQEITQSEDLVYGNPSDFKGKLTLSGVQAGSSQQYRGGYQADGPSGKCNNVYDHKFSLWKYNRY